MAFDLQWALIRIAALTGAADVDGVGAVDDGGDPPDQGLTHRDIQDWLERLDTSLPEKKAAGEGPLIEWPGSNHYIQDKKACIVK